MGVYVLARLNEGRFQSVVQLVRFARNLERAIVNDMRHDADEEDGEAMLAFWANALAFMAGRVGEATRVQEG